MIFNFSIKKNITILALGAESAGNFSVYSESSIFLSENFGDLLEEKNWKKFQKEVLKYLHKQKIKPKVILTDLHPLFKTTLWGEKLSKKFRAKFIQIQHHHSHIFCAIGDRLIQNTKYKIPNIIYGITMDGTGLGTDGKIWGGEIFKIKKQEILRIGHLENQVLLGGDIAIREPARMLIGVLSNISNNKKIYPLVKKYYTQNEFELLSSQLKQEFNCIETSSTGRVLDTISLLLGFCQNERKYKHEPIDLLEKNSTKPYSDLKPKIIISNNTYILDTNHLFNYVIKYLHTRDKKKLAATAQLYIVQGLYKIIKKQEATRLPARQGSIKEYSQQSRKVDSSTSPPAGGFAQNDIFISGGLAKNKIISEYFISKGAYTPQDIPPGDAGLSFGQIVYYFLS